MGMLANPGGAACTFTFGGGITEFKPKSWASFDGTAPDLLGPIAYRSDGKRVYAIPAQGIEMMGFDITGPNRVSLANLEGCALVRVASVTSSAPGGSAAAARGTPTATASVGAAVVDGAAFRCPNGSHFFVSLCQGPSAEAMCKLTDPTARLDLGAMVSRAAIAAKVQGCEAGGIRYGAGDKAVFVK